MNYVSHFFTVIKTLNAFPVDKEVQSHKNNNNKSRFFHTINKENLMQKSFAMFSQYILRLIQGNKFS